MTDIELSVLLVEDDAMVSGWVRMALEGSAIRLAGVAVSATEALALAGRRQVDVLLVDYRLPDGRGTELVRDLRLNGVAAPALLMTANEESGFNEAAREAGAQGTVLKTGSADQAGGARPPCARGRSGVRRSHPRRPAGK